MSLLFLTATATIWLVSNFWFCQVRSLEEMKETIGMIEHSSITNTTKWCVCCSWRGATFWRDGERQTMSKVSTEKQHEAKMDWLTSTPLTVTSQNEAHNWKQIRAEICIVICTHNLQNPYGTQSDCLKIPHSNKFGRPNSKHWQKICQSYSFKAPQRMSTHGDIKHFNLIAK